MNRYFLLATVPSRELRWDEIGANRRIQEKSVRTYVRVLGRGEIYIPKYLLLIKAIPHACSARRVGLTYSLSHSLTRLASPCNRQTNRQTDRKRYFLISNSQQSTSRAISVLDYKLNTINNLLPPHPKPHPATIPPHPAKYRCLSEIPR